MVTGIVSQTASPTGGFGTVAIEKRVQPVPDVGAPPVTALTFSGVLPKPEFTMVSVCCAGVTVTVGVTAGGTGGVIVPTNGCSVPVTVSTGPVGGLIVMPPADVLVQPEIRLVAVMSNDVGCLTFAPPHAVVLRVSEVGMTIVNVVVPSPLGISAVICATLPPMEM